MTDELQPGERRGYIVSSRGRHGKKALEKNLPWTTSIYIKSTTNFLLTFPRTFLSPFTSSRMFLSGPTLTASFYWYSECSVSDNRLLSSCARWYFSHSQTSECFARWKFFYSHSYTDAFFILAPILLNILLISISLQNPSEGVVRGWLDALLVGDGLRVWSYGMCWTFLRFFFCRGIIFMMSYNLSN